MISKKILNNKEILVLYILLGVLLSIQLYFYFNTYQKYGTNPLLSDATQYNGLLFVSGQVGMDLKTKKVDTSNFKIESKKAIENLIQVVLSAGSSLDKILNCTVYLNSMDNYSEFNEVYKKYFSVNPPSRVCIAVKELPLQANVEISCIAYK